EKVQIGGMVSVLLGDKCVSMFSTLVYHALKMFLSRSSMRKVLERHQHCSTSQQNNANLTHNLEYWRHEVMQYKEKLAYMEERLRNLNGENLAGFEVKNLQNLENQLQAGVTRVRARKMQLLMEHIQDFRKKELLLFQENELLKSKLLEASSTHAGSVTTETTSQDIQDISSIKASSGKLQAFTQENESIISEAETTLQLGCPRKQLRA
ncbi:hypothetical protein GOP47_0010330, partial [Adiantum capillus-veneris]